MRLLNMLIACIVLFAPGGARAWPDRPIQLIVPFPAGGTVDIAARGMAQVLGETLGVAVAVVNRDGAAGAIGARALATARPDGHTLGFAPAGPLTVQPQMVRDVGYTLASFRPVCQVFAGHFLLMAGRGGPADARAAIAAAGQRAGAVSFGYGGTGTAPYWAMLALQRAARVEFNGIPFRGDPPVTTGLLAGDLEVGVLGLGTVMGAAARLPPLLVFAPARLPELPDVPTATELGWPVVEEQFGGLIAPAALPDEVARRLEAACEAATQDPRMVETLRNARFQRIHRDAAGLAAALAADVEAKRALIAEAGITPQ